MHERLTDEESASAGGAQPGNVGSVAHAALADGKHLRGNLWEQVLADGQVGFQRSQVPVVDTEQPRVRLKRALQVPRIVHLYENVQRIFPSLADALA